jgi:hypothetical protein
MFPALFRVLSGARPAGSCSTISNQHYEEASNLDEVSDRPITIWTRAAPSSMLGSPVHSARQPPKPRLHARVGLPACPVSAPTVAQSPNAHRPRRH